MSKNKKPLVLCLTNTVAAEFTANVLLSAGGKPAMIENPGEVGELAGVSDAVLVNVGTLTDSQAETMCAAVRVCAAHGIPWVLDPVAVHLLTYRRAFIEELFRIGRPALVRGNIEEIHFLRDNLPCLIGSITLLATGAEDEIWGEGSVPPEVSGSVPRLVRGGTPMLQDVTATGCAQGALCAMFMGRGLSPVAAALAASRLMKMAGERAAARAAAPGTFREMLVDAIFELRYAEQLTAP